ncbi:restriction endonuclease subunit S, partial [Gemella morbillorum]|uniref:restriction endonuclease subunit S n=1 Tax=Gemella morbillorum TaxID=29391 RepID=UPI00248E5B43
LPSGHINIFNSVENTITVSQGGASAGFVNFLTGKFWLGAHAFSVIPHKDIIEEYQYDYNEFNRFLFHILKLNQRYLQNSKEGAGIPSISKETLSNIKIALINKKLQREIVRILDTFSELIAELQAELQAELILRQKQYEYYLNMLLKNTKGEKVELGSVCAFVRGPFGGSLKKSCFRENGYAVYEQQHAINGNLDFRYFIDENKFNELKRFEVKVGDMIVSCSGTIGKVFIIPNEAPKGIINQALLKLTPLENLDIRYLKYLFEGGITKEFNDSKRGGAIENVPSVQELKKIKIF